MILGEDTAGFVWGKDDLYFPNAMGQMTSVEGLLLVKVVLPRSEAPKLHGIPFLLSRCRGKSIASECSTCLENDNRHSLCKHTDAERAFIDVFCIYELIYARSLGYKIETIYEGFIYREKVLE